MRFTLYFFEGKTQKMQEVDELILKGFKEASTYEAINDAQENFERVENTFRA